MSTIWHRADVRFVFEPSLSDGDIATMRVITPVGDLLVMGEPDQDDDGAVLRVRRVHTNGDPASPVKGNTIGMANLQVIGQAFLSEFGYEQLILEGAVRTSGRRKGRVPRPIRFTRHPEPPPRSGCGGDR